MTTFVQVLGGVYVEPRSFAVFDVNATDTSYLLLGGSPSSQRLGLFGEGFTYVPASFEMLSGTITEIEVMSTSSTYDHYTPTIRITGGDTFFTVVSIDAMEFLSLYRSEDWAGIRSLLFPGPIVFNASDTLPSYTVGGVTYINQTADTFSGGAFNDVLIGRNGNDTLKGMGGDDYINGGNDNDALLGGDGADLIYGETGHDSLWAGSGNDIVLAGDGDDTIFGDGGGDDVLYGEAGNDLILAGTGASFAVGGAGDDQIWSEDGADYVMGEDGADKLFGGSGDDAIVAGAGADELYGGDGVDALYGGSGVDFYSGGAGTDFFYVHADGPTMGEIDIVNDFAAAASGEPDYLVLSGAFQDGTIFYADATYTWVASAVDGAFHYIALTNTSPDVVASQIIWV